LKLEYDGLLSNFAFTFNMRRHIVELMNANFGIYGMAELSSTSHLNLSRFVTETTQRVPQKVLKVRREVDECRPSSVAWPSSPPLLSST
jgi:hypothetical protein